MIVPLSALPETDDTCNEEMETEDNAITEY